jgi:CRP/FNR family transcriptional regulator, cyclic AMP receptor protein
VAVRKIGTSTLGSVFMAKAQKGIDYLATVGLFSVLSTAELRQVMKAADELDVDAGNVLVVEGRVGHEFFLILQGEAVVRRNGTQIARLGPGEYFGELALLDHGPRSATVVAATDMRLLVLGQREFAGLLQTIPGMAAKILVTMAHRLRVTDAHAISN